MRRLLASAWMIGWLGVLAVTAVAHSRASRTVDRVADRRAITGLVRAWVSRADSAWNQRNARLMFEGSDVPGDTAAIIRTPDGRSVSREANIADLQRRMDMTTRIDTMRTVVDSISFVPGDTAVVYSSQKFVRWMKVGEQPERRRISSVVHRQRFHRAAGKWSWAGPIEELNPQARWEDEPPRSAQ